MDSEYYDATGHDYFTPNQYFVSDENYYQVEKEENEDLIRLDPYKLESLGLIKVKYKQVSEHLPATFNPRVDKSMGFDEKIDKWIQKVPYGCIKQRNDSKPCLLGVAYPEDDDESLQGSETTDIIDYQAKCITKLWIYGYVNNFEPMVQGTIVEPTNYACENGMEYEFFNYCYEYLDSQEFSLLYTESTIE